MHLCCWGLLPAPAFDRYLLLMGCSAANPLHTAAAVDRWDRKDWWTDTCPFHRPCSADYAGSNNNYVLQSGKVKNFQNKFTTLINFTVMQLIMGKKNSIWSAMLLNKHNMQHDLKKGLTCNTCRTDLKVIVIHKNVTHKWLSLRVMDKTELSKVLRPTRHKIGHFADVLPSQSLGSVLKKTDLWV